MKHKLQKIKEESQGLCADIVSDLYVSQKHLSQIGDEYHRVTELSGQAARIVDQIDMDFKIKTKLSTTDMLLLFWQRQSNAHGSISLQMTNCV